MIAVKSRVRPDEVASRHIFEKVGKGLVGVLVRPSDEAFTQRNVLVRVSESSIVESRGWRVSDDISGDRSIHGKQSSRESQFNITDFTVLRPREYAKIPTVDMFRLTIVVHTLIVIGFTVYITGFWTPYYGSDRGGMNRARHYDTN